MGRCVCGNIMGSTFVTGKNTEDGVAEGILRILTGEFG